MRASLYQALIVLSLFLAAPVAANALETGKPSLKSLTVETIHHYKVSNYLSSATLLPSDWKRVGESTPEGVLLRFTEALGSGDFDGSLKYVAKDSIAFIKKMSSSMPAAELSEEMRRSNSGVWLRLYSKIEYGDYVIIQYAKGKGPIPPESKIFKEDEVFLREEGIWKISRDLVSDPVICCRDAPGGKVQHGGSPGGDCRMIMRAMTK